MFQLSLVDHIRLSFGTVVRAYDGHAQAAVQLARWSWYARLATLLIVGLAAGASLGAALRGGFLIIAAPCLGAAAFAMCAAYLAVDPEKRVYAHRATAAKLWLVCERFRSLLAEIHDQLIETAAIGPRRDALLNEVAQLFEQAPPADRETYAIAKATLAGVQGGGYSDQQVDQFLPVSMRRAPGESS